MKLKPKTLILILLSFGSISALATSNPVAHATAPSARLEVWSPDLHSSNITSLTMFPVGSRFTVKVNVTSSGLLYGFDVSLDYNITAGPNVLQASGASLTGGLFDPNNPPTGCRLLVVKNEVDFPPGRIRLAAVIVGGCSVPGTGTLFSVSFMVTGVGATSIDIVQFGQDGRPRSLLVDSSNARVDYQPVDAYFRNKPGIPPVAMFSFSPAVPLLHQTVTFDAKQSYDPDNTTRPGISKYVWDFGDAVPFDQGVATNHTFVFAPNVPAAGTFSTKLVVIDVDNGLPMRLIVPITVARPPTHDIAISLTLINPQPTKGDTLQIQVAIANRGTQEESANLNVTYDFQGSTIIAQETGIVLPLGALRMFNYNLSTSFLVPGTYTVTAQALIVNATTGAIVPDPSPSDNIANGSFVLLAPPPVGGHASLVKWRSLPRFHHEILSRNPIQTLLANVANNGNQTVDSYVQFRVTSDTGGGFTLFTREVTLVPGQEIDSRLDSSFTVSFHPFFPGVYSVTATVFYDAIAGSFKFTPDLSSQKSYSFIAS